MTPAAPSSRAPAGFSLIELMVVLAIIIVLAAVLLPAVHQVRDAALKLRCASNLRQIGLAHAVYVEDHNGVITLGYDGRNYWYTLLSGYVDESSTISNPNVGRVLRGCPTFRSSDYLALRPGNWMWQQYSGYSMTQFLANQGSLLKGSSYPHGCTYYQPGTWGDTPYNPLSAVTRQSSRPFLFDFAGGPVVNPAWSAAVKGFDNRHFKLANCLYFDLHVDSSDQKTIAANGI